MRSTAKKEPRELKLFGRIVVIVLFVVTGTVIAHASAAAVLSSLATTPPVWPASLAVGPNGELSVADPGRQQILALSPDGRFPAVAGTGAAGLSGDGGPALHARIANPASLVVGPDGTLYFVQAGLQIKYKSVGEMTSSVVREITSHRTIRTLAGVRPDCSAARPSASSVRAESAEFYGADLSIGPDGALRVSAMACPTDHSLGPSFELTRSGCSSPTDDFLHRPPSTAAGGVPRG